MAYTAATLITDAFYLSDIVSRELETVSGSQMSDGLFLLNSLLAQKSLKSRQLPYFQEYDFTTVAGTDNYYIPGLISAETLVFFISDIRFQIAVQGRKEFFGSDRVDGVQGPPWSGRFERVLGGTQLYLYLVPDQAYPVKIWGKFSFSVVTASQDLLQTMDEFYIEYLRYALCKKICQFYSITFLYEDELLDLEQSITDLSPLDLSVKTLSTLSRDGSVNWAQLNFKSAWWPS